MSTDQKKAVLRRWLEGYNRRSVDLQEALADEVIPPTMSGTALLQPWRTSRDLCTRSSESPGKHVTVEDMIAEGDKVVVRATMHGTHQGEGMGIPPTGKQVTVPMIVVYRIAEDKIAEHWIVADQLGLMQQLGAVPA
jgi:predicted ester cyclase